MRDRELEENKMELCKQREEKQERIMELSQRLSIAEVSIKWQPLRHALQRGILIKEVTLLKRYPY